ncbi:MAG: FtsW/RodA/SpoVE family cell cycle protein [Anaerolineales bacterium]
MPAPYSIEKQLFWLGCVIIGLAGLLLTIAPAVRERQWNTPLNYTHWIGVAIWIVGGYFLLHQFKHAIPIHDPYLFPVTWLLCGLGLIMIWRLSVYHAIRQTLWLAVVILLVWAILKTPHILEYIQRYKYIWLSSGLVLTALTILFGSNPSGSGLPRLWLGCCGFYFQPSEPLKLLLIIYLAAYLAGSRRVLLARQDTIHLMSLLAPTALMSTLAIGLLVVQRDLGTASIFFFLYATLIYLATERRRVILIGAIGMVGALLVGYGLFDVVRLRVDAWINPWLDPSGRSYQIVQSLIAVANGGIFGRGFGLGSPSLVPVAHSDFIYSAIAEESGLFGSIALLILLGILISRTIQVALHAEDEFQRFLVTGFGAYFGGQSLLIIAGNLRVLPLTGVTLPFVSYGGSSLLVSFVMLSLILRVSTNPNNEPGSLKNPQPYLYVAGFLLSGIFITALASVWFAMVRAPVLLSRTDNPRRAINDRYVLRGGFYDSQGNPLVITSGEPGAYKRTIYYPPLSVIIGYSNVVYGQSALEKSLDDWLRGDRGYTTFAQSWNHLLYGTPPPGLDIRLTIDLNIQKSADAVLGEHHGSLMVLNAKSGEILAIASHPGFDANTLEQDWKNLIKDPAAPFLDRALQGQYPFGELGTYFFPDGVDSIKLENAAQARFISDNQFQRSQANLIQPILMAYAAAALENGGIRPPLRLISAVKIPQKGWVAFDSQDKPIQIINAETAHTRLISWANPSSPSWEIIRNITSDVNHPVTWFIGGSSVDYSGTPLCVVIALEENNPSMAKQMGEEFLQTLLIP